MGGTDEQAVDALRTALEAMPNSELTAWYNAVRQPSEGTEAVAAAIAFEDGGISKVAVHDVATGEEIYSPWGDVVLTHEVEPFISKAEFREQVLERAKAKLI
jgi:hypothetical protein